MQEQIEMEVAPRSERGKNAARRMRAAGRVPAVVYGLGRDPQALAVDTKAMTRILSDPAGQNRVLSLQCGGSQEPAMAVDYQIDPVTHALLHVDLQRVDLAKSVKVSVPIRAVGVAFGVKTQGGFEEMVGREVRIECLPLEIPEHIEVDITPLRIGESIRVRDIPAQDSFQLADDDHKLLVHVMASRTADEVEEEEEQEEGEEVEAPA